MMLLLVKSPHYMPGPSQEHGFASSYSVVFFIFNEG